MISHPLLEKIKNISITIICILVTIISVFLLTKSNKEEYFLNIKNDIRDLNTSLLNNVYIPEEKEEDIVEKENNKSESNKKNEIKKDVDESKTKEKIEQASTTVENNTTQQSETQHNEGVYVGLKFTGSMTAYGKDCCGSDPSRWGITSSGYDLKQSLTYNDPTYGSVRIVASDRNFKLYSIIKVDDPIDGSYNAIVLDRAGSVIGLNKTKKFDLAVESESYASSNYGVHRNVTFEVLRIGK